MYTLSKKHYLFSEKINVFDTTDLFESLIFQSLWNTQNMYTKFAGLQYFVFPYVLVLHGKFHSFQIS